MMLQYTLSLLVILCGIVTNSLEKLKYAQMDLYKSNQREHISNVLVSKYANKSHDVSLWLVVHTIQATIIMIQIILISYIVI